ncbi:MAG: dienelactone hydrolase family protein [Rhabdaerophilum sp.]
MKFSKSTLIVFGFAGALCGAAKAQSPSFEVIDFPAAQRLPTAIEQQTALARGDVAKPADTEMVRGFFAKPAGPGPFATIVALHGCGGLSERFKTAIAERYVGWGYAVLVVDSFAHHPVKFACGAKRAESRADNRPADAIGALTMLKQRGDVDVARLALYGSSQGSETALAAVQTDAPKRYQHPEGLKYAAAAVYYPNCRSHFETTVTPTLIFGGEEDDWTPVSTCRAMMERRAGRGAPVELVVYPEARHGFDWIDFRPARIISGFKVEYHEAHAEDSFKRHKAFYAQHLGQ